MSNILSRLTRLEGLACRSALSPAVSLVYPSGEAWRLDFRLSGTKPGGGKISSEHSSIGAAKSEFDRLLKRYPTKPEPVLIICDV